MIDFTTPLSGMQQAETSLNRSAARIAKIGGSAASDSVDLSAEAVAMIEARNNFAANAKVARTEDQMNKSLLRILG